MVDKYTNTYRNVSTYTPLHYSLCVGGCGSETATYKQCKDNKEINLNFKRWVDSILDPVKIIPTEVFNRMHPYHVALTEELKRINQYYESIGLHFRELILVKPKSTNPGTFVLLNAKTLESLKASHTPEVFFTFRMSVVDILDAKGSLTSDSKVPIDLLVAGVFYDGSIRDIGSIVTISDQHGYVVTLEEDLHFLTKVVRETNKKCFPDWGI
jgi:hypothetical protein